MSLVWSNVKYVCKMNCDFVLLYLQNIVLLVAKDESKYVMGSLVLTLDCYPGCYPPDVCDQCSCHCCLNRNSVSA